MQPKKRKWTDIEDQALTASIQKFGTSSWSLIASALPGRTGKQCRERWTNQLDPNLNRDDWTPQEDATLCFHQKASGNCWSKIASFLPRRSANAIKNRWCWLSRNRPQSPTPVASNEPIWSPRLWGEALDLPVSPDFFQPEVFGPVPPDSDLVHQKEMRLDNLELCGMNWNEFPKLLMIGDIPEKTIKTHRHSRCASSGSAGANKKTFNRFV
jgi:hypothetical protein